MNNVKLAPPPYTKGFLGDATLRKPAKLWRGLTLGSPLVGAALIGGGLAAAGWYGAPWIQRVLAPKFGIDPDEYGWEDQSVAEQRAARKNSAWLLGGLGALAALAPYASWDAPGFGMLKYAPMGTPAKAPMQKRESLGWSSLPINGAMNMILNNQEMSDRTKMNSLALLASFNAPPTTQITGNDLIGQAVGTGLSAATGAAVGFVTAKALGLPNPSSTAILGAVANTLGPVPALAGSLLLGH